MVSGCRRVPHLDRQTRLRTLGNGKLLPEEKFTDFETPPETLPRSPGHWVEWVNCAKGVGPVPGSNFQYSGWTTEANHLGNDDILRRT